MPTEDETQRAAELAEKHERKHPLPPKAIRIDVADLPAPMSKAEVEAELERQRASRNTIEVASANGTTRTYRFRPNGTFQRVPPRVLHRLSGSAPRGDAPRRTATTSRRRPGSRARTARSPDDPDPADPALGGRVCETCGATFANRRGRLCPRCNQARYRARKRISRDAAAERYRAKIRKAVRVGRLEPYQALELAIAPSSRVLAMLEETAA